MESIFYYITPFSQDIVYIIESYIELTEKQRIQSIQHLVSKELYLLYPIVERITIIRIDNYFRWIIRNDSSFLFNMALDKIITRNKKNIKYKNKIFKKYIDYIKFLINSYNSGKCKTILTNVKLT